ncbi:hypothetical protein H0O00_01800 [Candidatus Micrarchaeota archaeon]|nr:hypothetical protein [Candidatus Micrarchaeota archaeon]
MRHTPQFKVRRIDGVIELTLRDNKKLMAEVAATFKDFAAFLDETAPGQPSFLELKNHFEVASFMRDSGKAIHFELCIRSIGNTIIAKELCLVDGNGKPCAVCRWEPEKGISFEVTA